MLAKEAMFQVMILSKQLDLNAKSGAEILK
jgi:hypothetical protein